MGLKNLEKIQPEYKGLVKDYCTLLQQHFGERLKSVCVFGSIATGRADPESDVDVLTIAEDLPFDILERVRKTLPIHQKLKETGSYRYLRELKRCAMISPIFLTPQEAEKHPPIMLDLVDEGVLICDKGNFLADVLESIRRRLRKLNAKKVRATKGHYWILKPDLEPGEVVEI